MNALRDRYASLSGRRVVITGGAGGIGLVTGREFAAVGAEVVLWDFSPRVLEAAREIGARGVQVDVGDEESVARAVAASGEVDVLANLAGVARGGPALDDDRAEWEASMRVNLIGTFAVSQALGRGMVARGHGAIINVASQAALVALEGHTAYAASKAGILAMTRNLAQEWGPAGVRVNAISPGVVVTPMSDTESGYWSGERGRAYVERSPSRRFGRPQEIAAVTLFLASDSASFVNGANIVVDGGFTAT